MKNAEVSMYPNIVGEWRKLDPLGRPIRTSEYHQAPIRTLRLGEQRFAGKILEAQLKKSLKLKSNMFFKKVRLLILKIFLQERLSHIEGTCLLLVRRKRT